MANANEKSEFWETAFKERHEMWGLKPAPSAIITKDFFLQNSIKDILLPGAGYGRNAQIFHENGIKVTGIEISETAIEMAKKNYGDNKTIYHGSVSDMPFDDHLYDGVFCYALIHLLDSDDRVKLIRDCYNQLTEGGIMVFVAISKEAPMYGKGVYIEKDRYENSGGAKIYFYDRESIQSEFGAFGLFEVTEIAENFPFYIIKCRK